MSGPIHYQANLAVRFLLELCALAALFYLGLWSFGFSIAGVALGLVAVLIAAFVWGMFASPRAHIHLPLIGRLLVETVFFGAAALSLYGSGHPALGIALLAAAIVNRALISLWKQDEKMRTDTAGRSR